MKDATIKQSESNMSISERIQELDNRLNTVIDNFQDWPVADVKAELAEIRHELWELNR